MAEPEVLSLARLADTPGSTPCPQCVGCKGRTERPLDHIEQPTHIALNLAALVMTVNSPNVGHSPTTVHSLGASKSDFLLLILLIAVNSIPNDYGFKTMNAINLSLTCGLSSSVGGYSRV